MTTRHGPKHIRKTWKDNVTKCENKQHMQFRARKQASGVAINQKTSRKWRGRNPTMCSSSCLCKLFCLWLFLFVVCWSDGGGRQTKTFELCGNAYSNAKMQILAIGYCLCAQELWNVLLPNCTSHRWFQTLSLASANYIWKCRVTIRRLPGNLQAVVSMLMCFSLERESGPKPSELQMKHSQGIKHVALQCSIACTIPLALITRNYFLHNFATTLQPSARRLHHRPTWTAQEKDFAQGCAMMSRKTLFCNMALLILNFVYELPKTFLAPLFTSINGFGRRVISVNLLRKAHCSDLLYKKLALRF